MGYWGWTPYVPVAARRAQAQRALQKAVKADKGYEPVTVRGRAIARTFWGKAWCDNLETYSDYENRLPRGRSYVRNGAVIDLKIGPGNVVAQVMGGSLYRVEIAIGPIPAAAWKRLVKDCTGSIATLVELLQGRLSEVVMERVCAPKTGLFPAPSEIKVGCSCPDWASMCKHVAAVLYGVGARLDQKPELLFILRRAEASELLTAQAADLPARSARTAKKKILDAAAVADVFGIELAAVPVVAEKAPRKRRAGPATGAVAGEAKAKSERRKSRATAAVTARKREPGKPLKKGPTSAG